MILLGDMHHHLRLAGCAQHTLVAVTGGTHMLRFQVFIAALVATFLFGATAAMAETTNLSDPRTDVLVYDWWDDDSYETSWPHDISRVQAANDVNGSKKIGARLNFHNLKGWAWDTITVYVDTDGDGGIEYRFEQDRYMGDGPSVYRGRFGYNPICSAEFKVDAANDFAKFSAPRACFDKPGAIRMKGDVTSEWGNADLDCCHDWAWDDTPWGPRTKRG